MINTVQDRRGSAASLQSADDEATTTVGALFTQAVVLYARATATKGDRPKLLGEAKLSADDRATHDEAISMRNSVVAHFGRGNALSDGPLVREAVLLSLYSSGTGPKKQVGVYTTRAQHKVGFAARLMSLVNTRLAELAERQQRLFDEADAALERAVRADHALGLSLPGFEFDVDAFCASPAAAAQMRSKLEAGSVEDMDYAVEVRRP